MTAKRYFYVHVAMPGGAVATNYVRTTHHPLHPAEERAIQEKVAQLVTEKTGQLNLPLQLFPIMQAIELERDVVMARWPEDFDAHGNHKPVGKSGTGLILKS